MLGEGEISLEQLYKMLHISKRKALWMLNNGIIPCRIRPTKTHRYVILLEDVEIYLQKQRKARREESPVGISGAKPRKREVLLNRQPVDTVTIAECYITLADDCKEAFRAHVEKRLLPLPGLGVEDPHGNLLAPFRPFLLQIRFHILKPYGISMCLGGADAARNDPVIEHPRRFPLTDMEHFIELLQEYFALPRHISSPRFHHRQGACRASSPPRP